MERTPEALAARVDELLREALALPAVERGQFGAVNWASLRCVVVEERRDVWPTPGEPHLVALIEEADHGSLLRSWMYDTLVCEGWDNVDVECEW